MLSSMLEPPSCLNGGLQLSPVLAQASATTALGLAKLGAHVYLACRSRRGKLLQSRSVQRAVVKHKFAQLDRSSPRSINSFATNFLKAVGKCDILVCSAGVNSDGARLQERTDETAAHNMTLQVNFLGHFLLIHRLLKCLHDSSSPKSTSRIVCLSSVMHHTVPL